MTLEPPTILGRYRLVERIGHGGTCEVFRAEFRGASGFEKEVAIKVLLPAHRNRPEFERPFAREAKLGAELRHENLVGVEDFGTDRGVRYLRMELVRGVTLRDVLESGERTPSLALAVVRKLALGLRYLHARGEAGEAMVHRDISPTNVLISRNGEVKLADFGLLKATRRQHLTRAGVRKGTTTYMSPEQARGETLGPASDQFPLGILLTVAAGGQHPFEADDRVTTLERIRRADTGALDRLPRDLRRIVECMLAADPADRFADMTELYRSVIAVARSRRATDPVELARRVEAVD